MAKKTCRSKWMSLSENMKYRYCGSKWIVWFVIIFSEKTNIPFLIPIVDYAFTMLGGSLEIKTKVIPPNEQTDLGFIQKSNENDGPIFSPNKYTH